MSLSQKTMFISGATMFLTAPLVGRLMTKVDARYMLAFGFAVVGLSNWQMTYITKDWEFWQLFVQQLLRGHLRLVDECAKSIEIAGGKRVTSLLNET